MKDELEKIERLAWLNANLNLAEVDQLIEIAKDIKRNRIEPKRRPVAGLQKAGAQDRTGE